VLLNIRNGYTDKMGFIDRIHCYLRERYPDIDFIVNREETITPIIRASISRLTLMT